MLKSIGVVMALALLATSCAKKAELNPLLKMSGNIVSTRAQNSKQFIAVVKLQNPALLENGEKVNGRLVVNKELLAKITAEQAEAIKALKALSPDVQIVYQYKMVLNGLAILAPIELQDKIKAIGLIAYAENSGNFERFKTMDLTNSASASPAFNERNSAKFIGAEKLNQAGVTGKNVKVGIIDTGIDYTHAMLGGAGTEDAYKAVDPDKASDAYPNLKVVGGIDLVGTMFNSASSEFKDHIPVPDMNPLDEAGHGTHVAGTVAGLGDGVNTYNGMAPDADLYAIKVFGADGSTSDAIVIAALEYAADPDVNGDNVDQLNVVNLSLGSGYGNPHILYSEAIKNLVNGGTVTVASAGNSGPKDYIVGAPGTSDAALSVAASVDNGDHLWKFDASRINLPTGPVLVEAVEAASTKKIKDAGAVSGKFVAAGIAAEDFNADLAAQIKGNIALIDRGTVTFNDKVKRAVAAGAIGVVVVNNQPGGPIAMGTTDKFNIPAIMISLTEGTKVKAAMKTAEVTFDFLTNEKFEKPELIDTLTDFSSKGPRSIDGAIKPEISAPGSMVISAAMGEGDKAVRMSGTSMAAPHMSGVVALLKQVYPGMSADEIKAVIMGSAKTMNVKGERYSVSMQGSGRIQADAAATLKVVSDLPAISLGEIGVESRKTVRKQFNLRNLTGQKLTLDVAFEGSDMVSMPASTVTIDAKAKSSVSVTLTLDASKMKDETIAEMDGWVKFSRNGQEMYRIPVLAVAHRLSDVEAKDLKVLASQVDAAGAAAQVTLTNKGLNVGEVLLFNSLGQDERKPNAPSFMSNDCDLQSAGYKIQKATEAGKSDTLQVAVKLFKPMTTWNSCDISLLIDADADGTPEQELLGSLSAAPGLESAVTLLDATETRALRKAYETKIAAANGDRLLIGLIKENYKPAVLDVGKLAAYNNSSVAVLEIPVDKLALTREGAIAFKLLVTHNEQSVVEFDDMLATTVDADRKISLREEDQSFVRLPDVLSLKGGETVNVELTKGEGLDKLMVLMPSNRFSLSNLHDDSQGATLAPEYLSH